MNKALLLALLFTGMACASTTKGYQISNEDANTLEVLDMEYSSSDRDGGEWARCSRQHCYILRTGEKLGQNPDGIYLVFPVMPDGEMSTADR